MRLLRAWLRTECFNFLISSKSFLDAQSKASILSEIFLNSRNEAHLARVSIFVHLVTDHIFIHPFILYRLILFYFISFHSILFIIFYRRSAFFYFLFFHLFCDNLPCSGMFRNVPECAGMFRNVPCPGFCWSTRLHLAYGEIWINQSAFSRREKLWCPDATQILCSLRFGFCLISEVYTVDMQFYFSVFLKLTACLASIY